jgi:hypothetical protein
MNSWRSPPLQICEVDSQYMIHFSTKYGTYLHVDEHKILLHLVVVLERLCFDNVSMLEGTVYVADRYRQADEESLISRKSSDGEGRCLQLILDSLLT